MPADGSGIPPKTGGSTAAVALAQPQRPAFAIPPSSRGRWPVCSNVPAEYAAPLRLAYIDLEAAKITVAEQLTRWARTALGPTKGARVRTIDIAPHHRGFTA